MSDEADQPALASAHRGPPTSSEVIPFPNLDGNGPAAVRAVALPERYAVRESKRGRVLVCKEAPGVTVIVDPEVQLSESDVRKLGERVILLDGAGRFGPMLDNARQLYNLDHHDGCVRALTLATCEQALVLVLKGLELDRADWTIYANEPDLDTVLGLWVLLNHRRIRDLKRESRDVLFPLLRLEGAIDANGVEFAEYCGLPSEAFERARETLDALMDRERKARGPAGANRADLVQYTADLLRAVDELVYAPDDLAEFAPVEEEYGHVDIGAGRVAVVCRDGAGIYEVERRLRRLWGDRLGIVLLENRPGHFTLRRVTPLADVDLARAYERLNLVDPAVDGRPPERSWGGSDDIGGSPRPDGSKIEARALAPILGDAYAQPVPGRTTARIGAAFAVSIGLLAAGGGAGAQAVARSGFPEAWAPGVRLAGFAVAVAALSWLGSVLISRRRPWLFGFRRPATHIWIAALPVVALAAAVGAHWGPRGVPATPAALGIALAAATAAAAAIEMAFRGLVHGITLFEGRVQRPRGPWFVSRATRVSALLYALVTAIASQSWTGSAIWEIPGVDPGLATGAAALMAGLALGVLRERSLSVWPGAMLQAAAAMALVAGPALLR